MITNRRKPTLTVTKVLVPANDPGTFGLQIDGQTKATGGNGTTTGSGRALERRSYRRGSRSRGDRPRQLCLVDRRRLPGRRLRVARGRREQDLHDHEHAEGAPVRDQEGRQRQRRHRGAVRLHPVGQRDRPDARLLQGSRHAGRRSDVGAGRLQRRRDGRPGRLHRQLLRRVHRHDRARRDQDLHRHEQRPAREADRQEDRHQRQRRHQDAQPTSRSRSTAAAPPRSRPTARTTSPSTPATTRSPSPQQPATPPPTTTATTLAIANGATATCTITNNDQPAKLIVKKIVINDNGGTDDRADFSFKVNGGNATPFEADGQNDLTVNAGNYSVTEPAAAGYTTTYDNCDNVAIANGGTATCTITNNDQPAKLIVKKIVINDNGGTAVASDFSFKVNGGTATPFEADGQNDLTVNAGNYSVTEPAAAGYTTTYDNCDSVALANGEHRDLHDHQQRPAGEADRDQAGRQRQRRQGGRVRLHIGGRRDQPDAGFVQGRRRPGRRGVTRAGRVQRQRDGRPGRVHRQLLGRRAPARSRSARPRPARSRTTTGPRS